MFMKNLKFCLLIFLFVVIGVCYADRVEVSNGGSFDGIITESTDKYVVLDLGTGSMKLDRRYISSVEYSGAMERDLIRKKWQQKYFLNKKFVPAGHEDMAAAFRTLLLQRDIAARASGKIQMIKRRELAYKKSLDSLRQRYDVANARLKTIDMSADVGAYNLLVGKVNSLMAEINLNVRKLETAGRDSDKPVAAISSYLSELSEFEAALNVRKSSLSVNVASDVRFFYDGITKKVTELNKEFSREVVASKRRGGSTLVSPVINNRFAGVFVLDTGADLVSMTERFARRLGININTLPVIDITVADGRMVKGHAVVLSSVRLGNAHSENVPAVILPGDEQSGHDGLLGMSFLRDYIVRLDGASGNLVLRRMKIGK
jgi:clan AA aspartic protease (TIGR02281 family)